VWCSAHISGCRRPSAEPGRTIDAPTVGTWLVSRPSVGTQNRHERQLIRHECGLPHRQAWAPHDRRVTSTPRRQACPVHVDRPRAQLAAVDAVSCLGEIDRTKRGRAGDPAGGARACGRLRRDLRTAPLGDRRRRDVCAGRLQLRDSSSGYARGAPHPAPGSEVRPAARSARRRRGRVQFRDVFDVDGGSDGSTREAVPPASKSTSDQVRMIVTESSRYNIGTIERTANVPVLPLMDLDPSHQSRFRFKVADATSDRRAIAGSVLTVDPPVSPRFTVSPRCGWSSTRKPSGLRVFGREEAKIFHLTDASGSSPLRDVS
jgi:hypothetical protein